MAKLDRNDWGCDATDYTVKLRNQKTGEQRELTVRAYDSLGAVIWCEKALGEREWKALR